MNTTSTGYIGILNFLTFGISIIGAVLAIDMYSLLRVGESGRTWRILVISSVLFVLMQVLRMTEIILHLEIADKLGQITALIFAMAFTYAFFRQRAIYNCKSEHESDEHDDTIESHDD
jgi:hypothetical protein